MKLKFIAALIPVLSLTACKFTDKFYESSELSQYQVKNPAVANDGQVRFIFGSFGTLSLGSLLETNIMPYKVYATALLMTDPRFGKETLNEKNIPEILNSYGFMRPTAIANWKKDLAPEPKISGNLGFVKTVVEDEILGQKIKLEIANINCSACHSGMVYDSKGMPTGDAWLGAPSTIYFDSFLNRIYAGLKIGVADKKTFLSTLQKAFPSMDPLELKTIKNFIMPNVKTQMEKLAEMDQVFPYNNGGPGITNGVAAFKRNAHILKKPTQFHPEEAAYVSVPDLSWRGFRSSFTVDGAYATPGTERFKIITEEQSQNPEHINHLAELASFFTFSAMGNLIKNIEPNIPQVQKVFTVLKDFEPQAFPGEIDAVLAERGSQIFYQNCSVCHGYYSNSEARPKLIAFPNRFVSDQEMKLDPVRWQQVSKDIYKYAQKDVMKKYVDAGYEMGGYVAPILSGLWTSAPYMHNGSVPTLWHFLHPESRPAKFQYGANAVDMKKIGILGEMKSDGSYLYPQSYKPWAKSTIYDTAELGRSNKGHEGPFAGMDEEDKSAILEYLKLL